MNKMMAKQVLNYKLIALIVFVLGLGLIGGGTYGLCYTKKIDQEYVSVTAKIASVRERKKIQRGKKRTYRDVIVNYEVNGKRYTERLNTTSSFMKEGDNIPLKYNPKQPNIICSVELQNHLFFILIFVGATFLVGIWFLHLFFRK